MLLRNRLTDRQLLLQKPILVRVNSCVALPPCRAWHLQAECWTRAQHTRCRRLFSSSSPSVRGTTASTKQAALPGACAKSLGSVGIGGSSPQLDFGQLWASAALLNHPPDRVLPDLFEDPGIQKQNSSMKSEVFCGITLSLRLGIRASEKHDESQWFSLLILKSFLFFFFNW